MNPKIKVDQEAPDFTLPDTELKPQRLSGFRGKNVVLYFYPGAFTSTCQKSLCTFQDSLSRFNDLNAQVLGISVNDPFTNRAFAGANLLEFPLLNDYNREVTRLYGLESKDFAGLKGYTVAMRAVFVIDKEGIVRYTWVSENPKIEPPYEEIEKSLENLA
ncbi:peroxiredoxin [Candidatus Borrarchaeum sp.]|uniref:peroxiredoxin n=1 Tax=Candidatus Borrarchaeum sp. TaxID=2846742 RepID=UPI00257A406F|nr:peroxiredoxin [Candidatus Borrarchaeum sp.]